MLGLGLGPYVLIVLYLALIAGALVSIARMPAVGLFVLIPLIPNQTVRYKLHEMPYGAQLVDFVLIAVAIGVILKGNTLFSKASFRVPIFALWALTFVTLWTGSLLNDFPLPLAEGDERFSNWKNYARIFLIPFLAMGAIRTRKQMFIAIALMCAGLAWSDRGFLFSLRGRSFSNFSYGLRDMGTMPIAGENGVAAFFAQMSVFLFGFAATRKFLERQALTLLAIVTTVCVVFTFSRGAYVALAVSFLLVCLLKRRMLLVVTAGGLIAGLAGGYALVPGAVIQRVTMLHTSDGSLESSAAGRMHMWDLALDMFMSNPLFGSGFDTFRLLAGYGGLHDTHNYYLKLLAEMGILGLFVYLALLAAAIWSCWRLFRDAGDDRMLSGLAVGGLGYMVCVAILNVFGDRWSFFEITGYTCIILGMVARGNQLLEDPGQDTELAATEAEDEDEDAAVEEAEAAPEAATGAAVKSITGRRMLSAG